MATSGPPYRVPLLITHDPDRFPVDTVADDLCSALRGQMAAVLQAPPASGKTTRAPLWLLQQKWLAGRKIIML